MTEYEIIINEILPEVDRAIEKHPYFPEDIIHMVAIIGEESGEALQAALNNIYENGSYGNIRKEVIHTAASCIRVLQNMKTENEIHNVYEEKNRK